MAIIDSEQADHRERRRDLLVQLRYSSVWIIFLIIPVVLVNEYSQAAAHWDAIAYGAIAVFGLVYVTGFVIVPRRLEGQDEPGSPGIQEQSPNAARFVVTLLLLVAIAALTIPSLQATVISFLPFFAGYGLFLLPIRRGLLWALGSVVVMIATLWAFGEGFAFGLVIGPLLSIVFVLIIRVMFEWSAVEERARLELAAVHEREHLSRDVHDILGHTLTVVALKTQLAQRTLRDDPDRAEAELSEVLAHTQSALDEVRATVGRLRTPGLSAQLVSAKTALDTKDVELTVRGSADDVATPHRALFAWAIREAVTNVIRHAEASACSVVLERNRVLVIDDGIGIQRPEGNGLSGLRRRVEDAGGTISLGPAGNDLAVQYAASGSERRPGTRLEVSFQ